MYNISGVVSIHTCKKMSSCRSYRRSSADERGDVTSRRGSSDTCEQTVRSTPSVVLLLPAAHVFTKTP